MRDPMAATSGNQDDQSFDRDGYENSIDVLIGRIIDGEATAEDRRRFESLAMTDAQLWQRLALRQQEMAALNLALEQELTRIDQIDPPLDAGLSSSMGSRRGWFALLAYSGWAAVIALTAIWSFTASRGNGGSTNGVKPATNNNSLHFDSFTPDEHLREYLRAPFVKGEMAPTLLHIETLPDGRKELHILRRFEETVILGPSDQPPVDDHNNITKPPAELRNTQANPKRD